MGLPFKRVAIIGVGLIGGSLGKAAKEKGIFRKVVGIGRNKSNLTKARDLGIVDARIDKQAYPVGLGGQLALIEQDAEEHARVLAAFRHPAIMALEPVAARRVMQRERCYAQADEKQREQGCMQKGYFHLVVIRGEWSLVNSEW